MSSGRSERFLASTSFRLSAAYAALLILAFLAAGGAAWVTTKLAAEREVRERVQLEMTALQHEIATEGMPAAVAAIHSRSEMPGALEYRLRDKDGALLVDGLAIARGLSGWNVVKFPDARGGEGDTEEFLTLTEATADGAMLTIGDDLDKAEGVSDAVLRSLFWVALGTLIIVIAAGTFLSQGTARRMRALSNAMLQVGRGDFSARAPEAGGDEIARIGRQVNEMLARIDLLVVNVRRVSTDIAHDLRTPLAHVRQDLEVAAGSSDPATTLEGIRTAQLRIEEILQVFQAILRLAEIDAGAARARFSAVDLAAVVERVTDAYRADIEAANRHLVVAPLAPTVVVGDRALIAQALANLLENAMRHTPPGSSISVALRSTALGKGFQVSDEGAGIPEADRERVLEPFVRLDSSRSSPGAGLGLSIVNAIARLHGARLALGDANPGLRVAIDWRAD